MEKSVKTILTVAFIVGMLMFFLTKDWRDYFHTWTLILALAGFVPIFMIFASIYLVKKMYKNQIPEENKPRTKNEYDLEYLQSLPPYERAKKKLTLLGLTKDKRYLLTPEESDAILQKAREKRMAEEMSLNRHINNPSNHSSTYSRSKNLELDIDDLERYLKSKVIGQDDAIKMLTDGIYQQAKAKSQNLGSYLFVGQTGVGKTETAKALAEYLKRW